MEEAKRARKAETPKRPSRHLRSSAPYFYPDPHYHLEFYHNIKSITVSSVKSVPKSGETHKSMDVPLFVIFYKKKNDWFIGHIQEYPQYESQGRTLEELRNNLIEINNDINEGLVPDAEPFQLMEIGI